jgi:hypothetical protein
MTNESPPGVHDDDTEGPGRPFSSWTGVYVSVAVATVLTILLLYWFTVAMDFSRT